MAGRRFPADGGICPASAAACSRAATARRIHCWPCVPAGPKLQMVVEQPLGHGPQQLLARAMAHIVAHAAEILQLQQAQRGRDGRAGVGGRVGPLDQAGAREQLRQAVVLQQGAHVLEGFLQPLRHVVECRDQGRGFHHGRVRQRLHRAPVTLGQAVGRVGRHGQGRSALRRHHRPSASPSKARPKARKGSGGCPPACC